MALKLNEKKKTLKKRNDNTGTGLALFLFCLVCFIFGFKSWSKFLDKHTKY